MILFAQLLRKTFISIHYYSKRVHKFTFKALFQVSHIYHAIYSEFWFVYHCKRTSSDTTRAKKARETEETSTISTIARSKSTHCSTTTTTQIRTLNSWNRKYLHFLSISSFISSQRTIIRWISKVSLYRQRIERYDLIRSRLYTISNSKFCYLLSFFIRCRLWEHNQREDQDSNRVSAKTKSKEATDLKTSNICILMKRETNRSLQNIQEIQERNEQLVALSIDIIQNRF